MADTDRKPDADGRQFVLMELERLEPALFLGVEPGAPARFAAAPAVALELELGTTAPP